ncbi:hypothetical protein ElyMa_003538400 [Elysia marginata]|uniref:Uncharacterized protein n=1 Tax=Elysia marginata TaxID=1093978 RepID=A0AAV4EJR2_9GAST|nr:hypothetical protein ElyMa_003538400 [Elysia marginata]
MVKSALTGFRNYDVVNASRVIWRRHTDQIDPASMPVPEPKSVPPPIPPIPLRSPAATIATSSHSQETPGNRFNSTYLPPENNASGQLPPPISHKEIRRFSPLRPDPRSKYFFLVVVVVVVVAVVVVAVVVVVAIAVVVVVVVLLVVKVVVVL